MHELSLELRPDNITGSLHLILLEFSGCPSHTFVSLTSDVIQGEPRRRTRAFLDGACFSTILRNEFFHTDHLNDSNCAYHASLGYNIISKDF